MKNRDVAKTVLATGAGVVVVTMGSPLLVALPIAIGIGAYLGKVLSSEDSQKDE